jgi:chemosensory pili system protein ChpA (sensor histidine kinase/response regulator)
MADPAPASAESLDRLNQAAVGLLDPLLDAALSAQPVLQARRLADALNVCARAGESAGVRGLHYLVTLVTPQLHQLAETRSWPQARDTLGLWIGDLIAFCAGHLSPAEVDPLMSGLQALPAFPAVPAQFVTLIRRRLAQDAVLIARLVESAQPPPAPVVPAAVVPAAVVPADIPVPAVAPEPASRSVGLPRAGVRRPAPASPAAPIPVARDELAMLAQAIQALAEESAELLQALPAEHDPPMPPGEGATTAAGAPDDPRTSAVREWLELFAERLGHWRNAAAYVGVAPLSAIVGLAEESVLVWLSDAAALPVDAAERLGWLPDALAGFLLSPDTTHAQRLCEGLADPRWPVALEVPAVAAAVAAITELSLVASRQVQASETALDPDDLSLAIPADADPRVVDNLLHELPALSAQLSAAVVGALAAEAGALADAQRAAHTLKGSANTVGIRGIATLAHQLEDMLTLLARRSDPLDPASLALLEEGADGLAEMCESVAGLGAAPPAALRLCQRMADWVAARLRESEAPQAPGQEQGDREDDDHEAADHEAAAATDSPAVPVSPGVSGAEPPRRTTEADEPIRVSAKVLDRMLELAAEASILLAQAQEQLSQLQETRVHFRLGSERLQDLAGELERVVDLRAVGVDQARLESPFDPLELDAFDNLHTVSRRIAESGADSKLLDRQLDRQAAALGDAISQLERVQGELRETTLQSRMVPVATIVPRLQRVARQAARMAGRRIELQVHGDSTAVDAQLLQSLVDPLAHLLRNAVDHGIEDEALRLLAGKPAVGHLEIAFEHTGRELRIQCRDDGRGLVEEAVRARAIARGLVDADQALTADQIGRLVMAPGFSTRDAASQLSGRGIGLDVVHRAITRLRGTIDLRSAPQVGLSVELTLPIALAGMPVLVARTPTHVLALSIRQVEHIIPGAGVIRDEQGLERFVMDQAVVPVRRLDELLGLPRGWFQQAAQGVPAGALDAARAEVALLVRQAGGELVAVIAPELSQTRRVVVRPLPIWLAPPGGVEGACVLGDGSVAAVIDLPQLLAGGALQPVSMPAPAPAQRQPVCLVVDDSVSVRRSMEAFLSDLGFEVDAAGDGLEALERMRQRVPDLAIVDLEMPRLNGLELAAAMRQDERTVEVPIIMITSRASEKHRHLALDAGVDVFMTKPYTEDDLASRVLGCLERRGRVG